MIRPYKDTDFDDVLFLQKVSYERPCTVSELREKLTGETWVATLPHHSYDVGDLIGAIITCPDGLIWSVAIAPSQRNKGWGSALIREARKNFPGMYLYVDTKSPAIKLYEREGFHVDQLIPGYYGQEDAYLMRT